MIFVELWRFKQWKTCDAYTQVETQELDGPGLLSAPIKHYEKNHQNEIIKHTLIQIDIFQSKMVVSWIFEIEIQRIVFGSMIRYDTGF